MKKYIPILKKTKLFSGISEEEILSMMTCLSARVCEYKKGECVFHRGEPMDSIAVTVEGELHIQWDDYWGNRTIVSRIGVGEMFGEVYVAPDSGVLMNDVVAVTDSTVILLNAGKMITVCSSACRFHSMVVQNLFFAISEKNRSLMQKLGHISKRSTREKLISYLSEEAGRQGSSCFCIPFNRQQLADYLSVDRSAMSGELCRMRDEGMIEFEKNKFRLL